MSTSALIVLNRPSLDVPSLLREAPPFAFHDPTGPILTALDLGATRGDGVFETISVGSGRPQALEHHLRRFAGSAARLELPAPDIDTWRSAILAAITAIDAVEEVSVKAVLTRGIEGDGRPTGWVYATHSPDYSRVRVEGIRVVTLDRGYRHDIESTSPWLLAGAKTLSYAVNSSVLREASRRGADDVIFVSSDGWVLEGPTSSVVFRIADRLVTPGTELGILDGTTQSSIFHYAESIGLTTSFEQITPAQLVGADAAWLVSSVRLAAPVRMLDGAEFTIDSELTADINAYLRGLRH